MIRRDVLKASLLVAGLSAPTTLATAAATETAEVTAGDVQRVAATLYGQNLTAEDAAKIAGAATTALSNIKYINMLKSDDVQTPFGYPALLAEASRT